MFEVYNLRQSKEIVKDVISRFEISVGVFRIHGTIVWGLVHGALLGV